MNIQQGNLNLRIESYPDLGSWKNKALDYLRTEEGVNNLFWQIIKMRERSMQKGWAGNVFNQGKIILSAIHTGSNFLLLSHGSSDAVHALAQFARSEGWNLAGVSGAKYMVEHYLESSPSKEINVPPSSNRRFKIFQTARLKNKFGSSAHQFGKIQKIDWPKARIWAQQFALEADPPMDLVASTQLAKSMYSEGNLFMLTDYENHPCAMAGFGRSTERFQVINMVYVPKHLRGLGIAKEIVFHMTAFAKDQGYDECLLFSDWSGNGNLYKDMGCKYMGHFVECDLV